MHSSPVPDQPDVPAPRLPSPGAPREVRAILERVAFVSPPRRENLEVTSRPLAGPALHYGPFLVECDAPRLIWID